MHKVTEQDLRHPDFKEGTPDDYEFREDGAIVRKDRWERGLRKIAGYFGMGGRGEWEISEVEQAVYRLVAEREATAAQVDIAGTEDCRAVDDTMFTFPCGDDEAPQTKE